MENNKAKREKELKNYEVVDINLSTFSDLRRLHFAKNVNWSLDAFTREYSSSHGKQGFSKRSFGKFEENRNLEGTTSLATNRRLGKVNGFGLNF